MIGGHALNWLEGRLQSLTKHRGKRNGLSLEFLLALSLLGLAHSCWPRGDLRKGQACQSAPGGMAILVHCFISVRCDPAKFPIIYRDLRLDYKLATPPIERRRN